MRPIVRRLQTKKAPAQFPTMGMLSACVLACIVAVPLYLACTPCATKEPRPTVEQFAAQAEQQMLENWVKTSRADWVHETFITDDTTAIAAEFQEQLIGTGAELAKQAATYGNQGDAVTQRKLALLKNALVLPAPADAAKRSELATITARLQSTYGAGKFCDTDGECLGLGELEDVIDQSRNPQSLLHAWLGWRTVSAPMRADFQRYVELGNEGARELGYSDLGAMWRSKYDMPPDDFAAEVDRLWLQVKPLYDSLQCHVRAKLGEQYGNEAMPTDGTIPAHLLGNMWAQGWANIEDLVAPKTSGGFDLTERLVNKGYEPISMVKTGEAFFTSLGFDPLPETFWQRSQFVQPRDRDVVCHASAWAVDYDHDLRIKMCIDVNAEDFSTIHHELGHNFYQAAYRHQDPLFRDSANDGFHEALGDTVALSITPAYLKKIGLIEKEPPATADLSLLMRMALDKVAFLPFGLLVDQWRWKVFSGEITPDRYNQTWWELRRKYQGVSPPTGRSEVDFDPGAKYHVAANVPYTRYFLAHILQFQFHRDLCKAIGDSGPLNRCSIYGSEKAGKMIGDMMALGLSRPWPEALASISGGSGEMDATAIIDYFAPLKTWLDEQNQGRTCGY